jgi:potassium/chloride transporter 9
MYILLSVDYRPSFKYFTWHTAFIGLVGTLVMMFLINSLYALTSVVLCLGFVIILHLFSPSREAHWGSISQALIFHQVIMDIQLLNAWMWKLHMLTSLLYILLDGFCIALTF